MTIKKQLLAGVATAGLLFAAPAFAETEDETVSGMSLPGFADVDTNGDSIVDESEFGSVGGDTSMISVYDTDGDGALDEEEYIALQQNQPLPADDTASGGSNAGAAADDAATDGGAFNSEAGNSEVGGSATADTTGNEGAAESGAEGGEGSDGS